MLDYIALFLTGFTTGGLSCLAVQGGLLTTSIANQVEKEVEQSIAGKRTRNDQGSGKAMTVKSRNGHSIGSIAAFLLAKLVAYTLIGFLLGWLGSAIQLTSVMRGWFQVVIGIFLLGNALRMFDIHPLFRYFSFEPPSWITRYIRRTARNSRSEFFTPIFLGVLTVFIPCGVTQTVMALALSTGNPVQAALMMFAFTLGTTPVFFTLAYLFTSLGSKLERGFLVVTAFLILILGVVSLDSGLNLLGSPVSISRLVASNSTGTASLETQSGDAVVQIFVENVRYSPDVVYARAGVPVQLELITDDTMGCTRSFTIPALNVAEILPRSGTTVIEIPPQKEGEIGFTCSMGMYSGVIIFQ
jgi:sulfite exporter TauE/SafE